MRESWTTSRKNWQSAEQDVTRHPDSPDGRIKLLKLADEIYPRASVHEHHPSHSPAAASTSRFKLVALAEAGAAEHWPGTTINTTG